MVARPRQSKLEIRSVSRRPGNVGKLGEQVNSWRPEGGCSQEKDILVAVKTGPRLPIIPSLRNHVRKLRIGRPRVDSALYGNESALLLPGAGDGLQYDVVEPPIMMSRLEPNGRRRKGQRRYRYPRKRRTDKARSHPVFEIRAARPAGIWVRCLHSSTCIKPDLFLQAERHRWANGDLRQEVFHARNGDRFR